jgi:PadR family transcriptional regulator PadR
VNQETTLDFDVAVHIKKLQKELNGGTVALVLLAVLAKADGALYGYQIAKQLGADEDSVTSGKQGALYPVLRTMSENGLLNSFVEPSVSGPPRRYYRITEPGRLVLNEWVQIWQRTKRFVDTVIGESA